MREDIALAVALLREGELVAFPTETVYGLGADALNPAAVAKIFAAKGRPADHPLIVHLPGAGHLERWAREIPELAHSLAQRFWPGPLTLVLKRAPHVPDAVTGGQDTVGLRVPGHPLALELLAGCGSGIAAPSANRYGRISPTTAAHVREELGEEVALILDGGPCRLGIESTILDLSRGDPVILRPGMISLDEIRMATGRSSSFVGEAASSAAAPRVPGMEHAHYAPRTPLRLVAAGQLPQQIAAARARGKRAGVVAMQACPANAMGIAWRAMANNPLGYAHELYAALREIDALDLHVILVEAPPPTAEWAAIADRVQRAASGSGA